MIFGCRGNFQLKFFPGQDHFNQRQNLFGELGIFKGGLEFRRGFEGFWGRREGFGGGSKGVGMDQHKEAQDSQG
jgi:hypothetical protein